MKSSKSSISQHKKVLTVTLSVTFGATFWREKKAGKNMSALGIEPTANGF
jgi:hypothetical protein